MHRFTNSTHPLDLAPRLYKRIDSSDLFSTHLLSEYLLDEKCGAPAGPVCLRWLALATVAGPRTTLDDDPRKWTVVISLDDDDSDAPLPSPLNSVLSPIPTELELSSSSSSAMASSTVVGFVGLDELSLEIASLLVKSGFRLQGFEVLTLFVCLKDLLPPPITCS
ncbi:hypothetical protein BHE74_00059042 [Ensete ventricosum]|nr:hypothetical protein BHE74_00059042 [Ensete ventricosum]